MTVYSDVGPFAILPEWLLDSGVSSGAVMHYLTLGMYADRGTHECWPSRATLAEREGCSVDTIDRRSRELVDVGALVVEHRKADDGDNLTNVYRLCLARPGGRETAAPSLGVDAAPPSRADAAQNHNHLELEPTELNLAPAPRTRDPLWDAFIDCWHFKPDAITAVERGRLNRACKLLRDVDADPAEIPARRQMYALLFPDAAQTPIALASHWAECEPNPDRLPERVSETQLRILRAVANQERRR